MASGRLKLSGLDPTVREYADWCLRIADYYGVPVTVTSGFRSWEHQQRLYTNYLQCLQAGRMGKSPDCKYPANAPGDSAHNWGLAWDSWVPDEYMPWWVYVREYAGFRVPSNDRIHAEVPNWREYVQ